MDLILHEYINASINASKIMSQKRFWCRSKIHIQGFCPSARKPTAQMPPMTFCQDCATSYKFQDDATASLFLDDASCDEETEA